MSSDSGRLRRVRELFDAVLDLPAAERAAYLARHGGDDPRLAREVEALVAEAEATRPALASRLPGQALEPPADPRDLVGERLGAYEVARVVGMGGMGAVYEAARADDQYRSRVAIKLVRQDLNSPATLARFRRERRILASLKHRNIATLLDGGVSPDGRPFLVMEFVEGEPITAWCDRRNLSVPQRLALFRQVCAAVQHAHRNLVIHRDLKPGNIFVTQEGDVKLLDFGVAKILGAEAEEELPLTGGGARAFTPEYASPEQVRGEALTTASDVYSLGAVLYELLAGRRPHAGGASAAAVERAVLEVAVPRPSTVVTEDAAARRGERDARRLHKRLEGDLDSIVMRALRPEVERRWASVEALADDLRRYLDGRPVQARRGWAGYRFRKFVRRNRAAVSATALLVLALLGGALAIGIEARRARREAIRAEKVSGFLSVLLQSVRPVTGGKDATVAEVLDAASRKLPQEMAGEPEVQAELEGVIGQSEQAIGRLDEAEKHFRAALRLTEQLHGRRSRETIVAMTWVAGVYLARSDVEPADSVVDACLALHRSISPRPDTLYASLLGLRGSIANARGDHAAAERAHRQALELRTTLLDPHSDLMATSRNNLAIAVGQLGRWGEAESLLRISLGIMRANHPPPSTQVADVENSLATALDIQGKAEAADSMYRGVLEQRGLLLGRDHPDYAFTLMNYAGFVFDQGRFQQAADLSRELLAMRGKTLPESHPAIATSLQTLGRCLDRLGRHDEAGRELEESLALRRRFLGPDSWLVASAEGVLGDHYTQVKDFPRAQELLLHADAQLSKTIGPTNSRTLANVKRLLTLYEAWGRPARAAEFKARLGTPKS